LVAIPIGNVSGYQRIDDSTVGRREGIDKFLPWWSNIVTGGWVDQPVQEFGVVAITPCLTEDPEAMVPQMVGGYVEAWLMSTH
jgi:hypothetical protein